jgi:hypothetical protein
MRYRGIVLCALMLVWAPGGLPRAQSEETGGPGDGELRDAMRRFFESRLRAELNLTDEQMTEILPMVESIEQSRNAARRERQDTVRALQDGMREGAADAELQQQLDRLDTIEQSVRAEEREVLKEIDKLLTVRQRVQFRFFTERFRRQLQNRIQSVRRERMDREDRRRPPRRP